MKSHVIVTGMHRSGTSYLIRALGLCGLYLGPESDFLDTEIRPNFGNPRGHWENVNVIKINENILKSNGGTWDQTPKTFDKTPSELENNITQILDTFHSFNALSYGMKDPRFSLTFEKWKPFMSSVSLVGIFRHPLKVAESLKIRNGFSYEKSLNLWLEYNQTLLKHIEKYNGFLIDFDWDSKKLLDETKQVAIKIGLADIDFSSWFSKELKKSDKSLESSYKLSDSILELYEKLKEISEKNSNKNLNLPSLNLEDYKNITRDSLISSNSLYQRTVNQARDEIKKLQDSTEKILANPLSTLLSLYNQRKDLQNSYPEAKYGYIFGLINWARNVSAGSVPEELEATQKISEFKTWYDESYQKLKQFHDKMEDAIKSLETKIEQRDVKLIKLEKEITKQNKLITKYEDQQSQIDKLRNEVTNLKNQRNHLTSQISLYQKELEDIKSSFGFKIIRSIGSKLDKLSGKKKSIVGIRPVISASIHVIEDEGISSFINKAKERVHQRDFGILTAQYETIPKYNTIKSEHSAIQNLQYIAKLLPYDNTNQYEKLFTISIVIPTNSNLNKLKELVRTISNQKGIGELEIILVNSGSDDLSLLHKFEKISDSKITIKIIDIDPSQFNHGRSRNLGAKEATNQYLMFMTDDALPFSENLFYQMCDVLDKNTDIAASTVKQIPRSDSDLMSCYSIKYFYDILKLDQDRIVSCENFEKLDSSERRRVAQIDDVCSCYRNEIFTKYQYKELSYGEDIELGVRFVRDGYKIAQLASNGVIHSHTRMASYYLKRQFTETLILYPLLKYPLVNFSRYKISSLSNLVYEHILPCYIALNNTIMKLKQEYFLNDKNSLENIFSSFYQNISNFLAENKTDNTNESDSSLDKIFNEIFYHSKTTTQNPKENIVLISYLDALKGFEIFIKSTYPNIQNMQDEFTSTLYKIFGSTVGSILGSFFLDQIQREISITEQERLASDSVQMYLDYNQYKDSKLTQLKEKLISGV